MMFILYSTFVCDDGTLAGIFVTTGQNGYSIYRYDCSDNEWLIPGTWKE